MQTAVHRGKRKMRRSARNRKTTLWTDSGQWKARQGQYRVGQNSLLLKKNQTPISFLDQTSEPTRNAFGLSLDSGADRTGLDPNSGGPCCRFMSAKVTEMLVGASGHRWSCSLSLHGQSKSGFIFFYCSWTRKREREKQKEDVKLLRKNISQQTVYADRVGVNSAVWYRESCVFAVNVQRTPNEDQQLSLPCVRGVQEATRVSSFWPFSVSDHTVLLGFWWKYGSERHIGW